MATREKKKEQIDRHLFLRVMGSFASGVTVVTTLDEDGAPRGFTASAVSSLSLEPRMLLICVNEHSTSLEAIKSAACFGVNILAADQQEIAQQFAPTRGLAADDLGIAVTAAALIAAVGVALDRWQRDDGKADLLQLVDEAIDALAETAAGLQAG